MIQKRSFTILEDWIVKNQSSNHDHEGNKDLCLLEVNNVGKGRRIYTEINLHPFLTYIYGLILNLEEDESNTSQFGEKSSSKTSSSVKSKAAKKIMKLHKSMSKSFEGLIDKEDCEDIVDKLWNLSPYAFDYCLVMNTNLVIDSEGTMLEPSEEEVMNYYWLQKHKKIHLEYVHRAKWLEEHRGGDWKKKMMSNVKIDLGIRDEQVETKIEREQKADE